jgi:hypothetical protein
MRSTLFLNEFKKNYIKEKEEAARKIEEDRQPKKKNFGIFPFAIPKFKLPISLDDLNPLKLLFSK